MLTENGPMTNRLRLIVLALVLTFGFSVIVAQLGLYQIVMHDKLYERWEWQLIEQRDQLPERGLISDAHGYRLAMNVVAWDIEVSPSLIDDPDALAVQLSELLDLPPDEIHSTLVMTDVPWIQVAQDVPLEVGEVITDLNAGGLICNPRYVRVYAEGGLFAHVIGFVNRTGEGFYGVEGYYNPPLKGQIETIQVEKSAVGDVLPNSATAESPFQTGANLVLTLDRNIQYIAEQELRRALDEYGAESGTVIVMDPRTGALLASVSYPTYDPNDFGNAESDLLRDPAVSSLWEPGSIFKIITWAAALDAGVISPGMTVYDDGKAEVGGRIIQNWDRQAYGRVTMTEGLIKSLNTVAAYISTTLGKDSFYLYLRRFGFDSLTDIDLASEGPGMMKQPGDPDWFPSELGTNSFGQGIAVTPIQMITAVSAVANRGMLMKPYVVQQMITTDEETGERQVVRREPTIVRRAISQETAETLTAMLTAVVEQGATKAQVPGYRIAGKTGTAQIPTAYGYHPSDTIGSFVGFAPADDPQFIVLVKLDKPEKSPWGSQTAAPTFRAIAERLFVYLQIPPDDIRLAQQP